MQNSSSELHFYHHAASSSIDLLFGLKFQEIYIQSFSSTEVHLAWGHCVGKNPSTRWAYMLYETWSPHHIGCWSNQDQRKIEIWKFTAAKSIPQPASGFHQITSRGKYLYFKHSYSDLQVFVSLSICQLWKFGWKNLSHWWITQVLCNALQNKTITNYSVLDTHRALVHLVYLLP